jgi:hypothetical protein
MRKLIGFLSFSAMASIAASQGSPVALTGWHFDGIANGAPINGGAGDLPAIQGSTTGTLDGIFVYYQQGFRNGFPAVGLPANGVVNSAVDGTVFQLQSYSANNMLLLGESGSATRQNAEVLFMVTPRTFTSLQFLVTGFNGSIPLAVSLNFTTGSPTLFFPTAPDNFNGANPAIGGFGRVDRNNDGLFENTGTNPRLYQINHTLSAADQIRTLQNITFVNLFSGAGTHHNVGVFAVSGSPVPEPATLLVVGAGALALLRRRRR